MKHLVLSIILVLTLNSYCFGEKISGPPPLPEQPPQLQHYLQEIFASIHAPEVTTTAPNDNIRGLKGKLIIYDNSDIWELWVKDDVDSTSWQQIGGVPTYGEIWVLANTTATDIVVAGTFAQVTIFANNGQNNNTTPDHTNDHITILTTGIYLVTGSFHCESVGGGAADTISVEVRKNGGTTTFDNLHAHRKLAGGGGDIASISISGLASFTADDTIELWLTNDDNATDILVADANLSLVKIGD